MKISIGSKIIEGPWGGGNLFVKNLWLFKKKVRKVGYKILVYLNLHNFYKKVFKRK